jgi:DNA-binding transcriptional MerR regulator
MDRSWTILELAELAAETLATAGTLDADTSATAGGPGSELRDAGSTRAHGRVRDVPNERLIRWYGTVGLVDPPLSRRGRVARYGRRHLLQLVAVKRRQAEGKSLAEIQAELAGVTDEALAVIAGIPALGPAANQGSSWLAAGAIAPAGAGPGRFWARQPQQPVTGAPATSTDQDGGDGPAARLVYGIRLAPGATLLLDGPGKEPGPEDMTRIVNAARPLLEELASQGLAASATPHAAEPDNPQTGAGHEH